MAIGYALIPHRISALLSVFLVLLFSAAVTINVTDNINHIAEAGHHGHSLLNSMSIDHPDADMADHDQETSKSEHSHPNLCGGSTLCMLTLQQSLAVYAVALKLWFGHGEPLVSRLVPGVERPPKFSL